MKLIEGWKEVWSKLWSVRLALIAALLSAVEVGVQTWLMGQPPVFASIAFVVSLAGAVARLVAQPKLKTSCPRAA